ncbi:MAG: DegT/DnrJ/EryC1/StrS family aminotransferase, partial [Proteobacteria bacterium]|nr:DegT/DnrJ/EryC1/StrS family aminotransferase [Pseudomonadota bacterium]
KLMLIDNAAGIDQRIPDWPYQSFSLHHTKPYGAGEGGLFTSPRDEAEEIYALLNYGAIDQEDRGHWLNNGKISDIACAFHLDRLAKYPEWSPRYREQAERVWEISLVAGLTPLIPENPGIPATSHPFLAPEPVPLDHLLRGSALVFGKYYKPLADLPGTAGVYARLVNIPTHPDVAALGDGELAVEISGLLAEDRAHA